MKSPEEKDMESYNANYYRQKLKEDSDVANWFYGYIEGKAEAFGSAMTMSRDETKENHERFKRESDQIFKIKEKFQWGLHEEGDE